MAEALSPEPRFHHESALIDDELHVFGGMNMKQHYFSRNEIWTYNVREEKKWISRFAEGGIKPCWGARCVVIDEIIYSYGGNPKNEKSLGEVSGLDPKRMKWIQLATPTHGKKPWQRFECCLWALGGRMIMFGGMIGPVSQDHLQSGAQCKNYVNNEIYEFVFEEEREKGYWLDVQLSGQRPEPRAGAAIETIDQNQGFLHGGYDASHKLYDDAFVIDLKKKAWIRIEFLTKPLAQGNHAMCRISKTGFEERNCFFLIGEKSSNHAYILDYDNRKSYIFNVNPEIALIRYHTLHCVQNRNGSAQIYITGGQDVYCDEKNILSDFFLGPKNESYMQIENQILSSTEMMSAVHQKESQNAAELERKLEEMRIEVLKLRDERTQSHHDMEEQRRHFHEERMRFTEQRTEWEERYHFSEEERMRLTEQKSGLETRCNSFEMENDALRTQLVAQRRALEVEIEEMAQAHQTQMRNVEAALAESKQSLDQFVDVLSIRLNQVHLTNEKLGSGAFADVFIGRWHGMQVAVKKFHALITTPRTIPTFQKEVLTASRLHHPNIIRVCGAVMEDGVPFQIVYELLEGSVSEVIDAAHSSQCYLSHYEQLSIAVQMTSAISYLHGLHPRPYVHADIRPTNVLVTRNMTAKIADLGAAHLLESSKSAGPLSPQYLAPERMPPQSGRSSLPSDVYSLGVSLIEIFTGVGPISDERNAQLLLMRNRHRLHVICSRMILSERERPKRGECLAVLIREIEELAHNGFPAIKRMVKGKFKGEGENRRHEVVLSDSYHS